MLAKKKVMQSDAYYSKTGADMRASDPNWRSLTVLFGGESFDPAPKYTPPQY